MGHDGTASAKALKALRDRPRAVYLLLGLWAVSVCWSVGSVSGITNVGGGRLRAFTNSLGFDAQQVLLRIHEEHSVQTDSLREQLPMGEEFYTSTHDKDDTSTTIIFNVFRGEPEALRKQLEAALNQKNVKPPEVWVMCFNAPSRTKYEDVVAAMRLKYPDRSSRLVMTTSDFNHKFHGRFLLAYMATTKYVLIVDDDKNLESTSVYDFIKYMNLQKGVWGNFGHLRATSFDGYKSWPNAGYNLSAVDWVEQDYLCGMWFLEQTWLEYFMKERPPSWATSEDMHLSHVMRKYLNLNSYAGKVALHAPGLPEKDYAATVGSALDLREYIFDHQLGRGNKVANAESPLDTLVYAESASDIEDFMEKIAACPSLEDVEAELTKTNALDASPWCNAGRTAAVFRGAKGQDINSLITAAERLCNQTSCEYFSAKPNIAHVIRYFNMREGYGQADVDIPFQTGTSDVIMSMVGILNNVLPSALFLAGVEPSSSGEIEGRDKENELLIYHRTVLLAVDIHRNSKTNPKWSQRQALENDSMKQFPADMKAYIWLSDSDSVTAY